MRKIISLLLLFTAAQCVGQQIAKDKALEDLNYLAKNIQKYNPALVHYHPSFDSLSRSEILDISNDSISMHDLFFKVHRICALANEGHFNVGSRDDFLRKRILENKAAYFPIQVKLIANRIFVVGNFSNENNIEYGSEILAINGLSSQSIIDKLVKLTPSDGHILTYAHRKIEDNFAVYFYFFIDQSNSFQIDIVDSLGVSKSKKVEALVRSDQVANLKKYYSNKSTKEKTSRPEGFYSLTFNKNYALLQLSSFDFRRVNKYEVRSKKLYKDIFKELDEKQVQNLVVDLRNNTGGRNEFADDMVPYILKSSNGDSFIKKTISWNGKEKKYGLPKASKLVFKGNIYVLVNGKTYSAGSSLARYLKEYGNAIVIGTETGTRYEGFAAGSAHSIVLANSGLPIDIPRYHIVFSESSKQTTRNRGLLPDHQVETTSESFLKSKDLHIEMLESILDKN